MVNNMKINSNVNIKMKLILIMIAYVSATTYTIQSFEHKLFEWKSLTNGFYQVDVGFMTDKEGNSPILIVDANKDR